METATRKLKIFCPTHQSVFEVEEKPQIICEIREHALSTDFPRAEFWEFCCDCQTYSPSRFGTGGKMKDACPHCERKTTRRFLCGECKIIAYDSGEETKGKIYQVDAASGVEPGCPGCRTTFGRANFRQHDCADIEGSLLTSREQCPFCQKSVVPKTAVPTPNSESVLTAATPASSSTASTQCPRCGHWGIPGRIHCGNCGAQINARAAGVNPGSSDPQTQLLGSICPNCGGANQAGSIFCSNCGQALKEARRTEKIYDADAPISPAPPPNFAAHQSAGFADNQTYSYVASQNSMTKTLAYLIIGGILLVFFIGVIAINSNKPSAVITNSSNFNTLPNTTNSARRTNTMSSSANDNFRTNSNTYSNYSSSSVVGRTGRLERNVKIRSASNKYGEDLGTHYQDAEVKILEVDSYSTSESYSTWYRVQVLKNGCDRVEGNGCGNDVVRDGYKYPGEAATEGWMNARYIILE